MHLTDAQGDEYLDFFGGILTVSVGHCNEAVNQAVIEQNQTLQHVSTLYINEPQVEAGQEAGRDHAGQAQQELLHLLGHRGQRDGRAAGPLATGRSDIIALRHAYSGRSEVTLNITAHAPWRRMPSSIPYIKHAHNPYCYRCAFGLDLSQLRPALRHATSRSSSRPPPTARSPPSWPSPSRGWAAS